MDANVSETENNNNMNNNERLLKKKKTKDARHWRHKLTQVKYLVLGREVNQGLLFKAFLYVIFISTSYIYLNPILTMLSNMFMSMSDLIDPTVTWIPSGLYFGHIEYALNMLNYSTSFWISMIVSLSTSIFHVISTGFAGYAMARLEFPFKKAVFGLLLLAFIIPPQVTVLPTIIAYNNLGFNNHFIALIIPSILGFGVKGALFVIIFRQFFSTLPKELEEAARIDGASAIKFYFRVMLPLSKSAMLVVFLFSFVWTWNDTYYPRMFLGSASLRPLASETLQLDRVIESFVQNQEITGSEAAAITMAASFLVILPPLLIYLVFQKYFVEGVERTGLVE